MLGHWRQTLADLERDPLRLADRLDPYAKLLIYSHELNKAGFAWADLRDALGRLADLRANYSEAVLPAVLRDSAHGQGAEVEREFQNAVLAAGTRNTVVSQWKVDSESTSRLMVAFHQNRRNGMSDAESLRAAALSIRKEAGFTHPFYWAPFIVIGAGLN